MNEQDKPRPARDPGDRVVRIVVISLVVLFLLGCASTIALFAVCASL